MSDNSRSATLKVRAEVSSFTFSLAFHCKREHAWKKRAHSPDLHETLKYLIHKVRLYGEIIVSRLDIRWQAKIAARHGEEAARREYGKVSGRS